MLEGGKNGRLGLAKWEGKWSKEVGRISRYRLVLELDVWIWKKLLDLDG